MCGHTLGQNRNAYMGWWPYLGNTRCSAKFPSLWVSCFRWGRQNQLRCFPFGTGWYRVNLKIVFLTVAVARTNPVCLPMETTMIAIRTACIAEDTKPLLTLFLLPNRLSGWGLFGFSGLRCVLVSYLVTCHSVLNVIVNRCLSKNYLLSPVFPTEKWAICSRPSGRLTFMPSGINSMGSPKNLICIK